MNEQTQPYRGNEQIEIETTVEEEAQLSTEHAAKLLYFSFYFSQGLPALQVEIFQWLHQRYPSYRGDTLNKAQLLETLLRSVEKTVPEKATGPDGANATHAGIDRHKVLSEIESYSVRLLGCLNGEQVHSLLDYGQLTTSIATKMIRRDYHYLVERGSRPRFKQGDRNGPMHDPFLSHVCYYALMGRPTGVPEYDHLMQAVATIIRRDFSQDNQLIAVIARFNRLHHASVSVH
ncbi:MAG: hypothetical protein CEO22_643 [Candidatus Berkelbacteria bacterium Gr01-1014_85]|uniref:Uncharacterized protein n=1 Tax=Candidatus Berkelbacteria bacterium Gr01-1014_85 TaxID=2017150 RepID=A0A554J9E2_9BACT|nr:MAG: hypothetical protein CEO22_643 [Candidatus Berkelbacteria bacterium Gr01-1014_85]